MLSESASPVRVHEGIDGEDDDGVLFGSSCDRRVFFASSNKHTPVVAADVLSARQRLPTKDPLHALGLFPLSPYAILRKNTTNVVVAAGQHNDSSATVRGPRSKSPTRQPSPPSAVTGALWDVCTPPEKAIGGKHYASLAPKRYQETACEIYSPQRLQRYRGRRRRNVDATPRSFTCLEHENSLREGDSTDFFLEKIRTVEKATSEEVARLRCEADPSVMIRRFWRYSGVPLDHIFATAARVYRRSRLQPAVSSWHSFAVLEARRISRQNMAATVIQCLARIFLARRVAGRYNRAHGPAAAAASRVIQSAFRSQEARKRADELAICRRKRTKLQEIDRQNRTAQDRRERWEASIVIQTAWRAAIGRTKGAERARRELRGVLVDLGGGLGRMHRVQECSITTGCLEHVALARACEVALRLPVRSRRPTREVLLLLLRCRLLLVARRQLRREMGGRWTKQAEAFLAMKAGLDEAQKEGALRQGQSKREEREAEAQERERRERDVRALNTESRLRDLRERERIQIDSIEERRRERCERYLMWRQETRQHDITEEARAKRARRESRELVMMRREELLAREAWSIEDATVQHAIELWEHGDRISRMSPLTSQARQNSGTRLSFDGMAKGRSSPRNDPRKPEVSILRDLDCVVDGRRARVTATLRPSKASMLAFKKADDVRATLREHNDARKSVAHWGARCRVDAEHAARVRGELFRLRCKTRTERRRKAADVATATSVAEESIAQLRVALRNARCATISRATTLADALGVNPPKSLLTRRVSNEHRDRLEVRDVTARGCTYRSKSSSPAVWGKGHTGGAISGGPRGPPGTPLASIHRRCPDRPTQSCSRGPWETGQGPPDSPGSSCGPDAPQATVSPGSPQVLPSPTAARAKAENVGNRPLSPPSSRDTGSGWNREWCRSVDAWCRNASARFRARQAGEVVRSARRLHWLAGSGRDGVRCTGEGPVVRVRDGMNWPSPSEAVGAEAWAALAAFGDVADLLEIVGSTAELVVSVSVDAAEQRRQLEEKEKKIDVKKSEGREVELQRRGSVTNDGGFSSEKEDEIGNPDSSDAAFCLSSVDVVDKNVEPAEQGFAREKGKKRRDGSRKGRTKNQGRDEGARSLETVHQKQYDPTQHEAVPTQQKPAGLGGATGVGGGVALARFARRPAATPPTLHPVHEEGDTDIETCSEDGDHEEEEGEETGGREGFFPRSSMLGAEKGDAFVADGTEIEASEGKSTSGAADDGTFGEGEAAPERFFSTARITLDPSTIARSVGISPLSAFVLQAARRARHRDLEAPTPDDIDDAYGGSRSVAAGTGAPSSLETTREKVAKEPRNVDDTEGPGEIDAGLAVRGELSRQPNPTWNSCISDTEKRGLACAVETLVLRRIRVVPTSKRHKTTAASAKRAAIRLRLDDTPMEKNDKVSKSEDTVSASAAQAPAVALPLTEVAAAEVEATTLETTAACTRRYVENPIHRWVGRVDGRRCLLSCSAAQPDSPSPAVSSRFVGLPPGKRRGGGSNENSREGGRARCVRAMFMPNSSIEGGDAGCRPSSKQHQKQRFGVVGRVPLAGATSSPVSSGSKMFDSHTRSASVGYALGRPLCRNCGRRALQRLLVSTNLLVRSEAFLPPCRPSSNTSGHKTDPMRFPADEGSQYAVEIDCFLPERSRQEVLRQRGSVARRVFARGRLADWTCSSGATLCTTCLEKLQPAEVALGRVTDRS